MSTPKWCSIDPPTSLQTANSLSQTQRNGSRSKTDPERTVDDLRPRGRRPQAKPNKLLILSKSPVKPSAMRSTSENQRSVTRNGVRREKFRRRRCVPSYGRVLLANDLLLSWFWLSNWGKEVAGAANTSWQWKIFVKKDVNRPTVHPSSPQGPRGLGSRIAADGIHYLDKNHLVWWEEVQHGRCRWFFQVLGGRQVAAALLLLPPKRRWRNYVLGWFFGEGKDLLVYI